MKIILIIVIFLIILAKYFNNPNRFTNNNFDNTSHIPKTNYKLSYEKKTTLLTESERKFYKLLKTLTDEMGYSLFSQVSLYQIIRSKDQVAFNKIRSKSIDFVITDNYSNIKLCIELDDSTHQRFNRIERDKFINELFEELDIKLLHIPVQNFYNLEDLKCKIENCIITKSI